MNSCILQRHLENRLVILIKACAKRQTEDDGLIYTIISDHHMDDQSRMNYIAQIEYRLPEIQLLECRNEWSLNSRYSESDSDAGTERWQRFLELAPELVSEDEQTISGESCARLADALTLC